MFPFWLDIDIPAFLQVIPMFGAAMTWLMMTVVTRTI